MITAKITGAEAALRELAAKLGGGERKIAEEVAAALRQCARVTHRLEALPLPITEPVEHMIIQ